MKEILKGLNKVKRGGEARYWFKSKNLSLNEARIFLELSKARLLILKRNRAVPFHKIRGEAIYFNKKDLEKWLVQICEKPKSEIERRTAEHLKKIGRI